MGLGMPIPDLSNKPGPGRPGWGPTGSYDFQFEVAAGQVGITVLPRVNGLRFTIKWQDGTEQAITEPKTNLQSPTTQAGIISINNEQLDSTWCDDFAVASGKQFVTKVISWGQNPWNRLASAFQGCVNLITVEKSKFFSDTTLDVSNLFNGCTGLTSVDFSEWSVTGFVSGQDMFKDCTALEAFKLKGSIKFANASSNNYWFRNAGTSTGCLFDISNLSFVGSTGNQGNVQGWFYDAQIKDGSKFDNWTFPAANWSLTQFFFDAHVPSNDATISIQNWTLPNNSSTSVSQLFRNLQTDSGSGTNLTLNLSNWNFGNITGLVSFMQSAKMSSIIGLSTWVANNLQNISNAFATTNNLGIDTNDNFTTSFWNNSNITNCNFAFRSFGASTNSTTAGAFPSLNGITIASGASFLSIFENSAFNGDASFTGVNFPSSAIDFSLAFYTAEFFNSNSKIDFSNTTVKFSNLSSAFRRLVLDELIFGNNVDFSATTNFLRMFKANTLDNSQQGPVGSVTFPTYNPSVATNISFASATDMREFANINFTTCQSDNLIRALYGTKPNPSGNANQLNLKTSAVTAAPSIVNGLVDELEANGYSITVNSTDAALPFAYPAYVVDPDTGTTSLTPSTLPPLADRNFTSTNSSISVNQTTGVLSWTSGFEGFTTVRCTYANGCYNEVSFGLQVPFTFETLVPASGSQYRFALAGDQYIEYGDGTAENNSGSFDHTYSASGSGFGTWRTIKIFDQSATKKFTGISAPSAYNFNPSRQRITNILKWGNIVWSYFSFRRNMNVIGLRNEASDYPKFSSTLNTLENCFNFYSDLAQINSGRYDMNTQFVDPNNSLNSWKLSTASGSLGNITSLKYMFLGNSMLGKSIVNPRNASNFNWSFNGATATAGTYGSPNYSQSHYKNGIYATTVTGSGQAYSLGFYIIIDGTGTVNLDSNNFHVIPTFRRPGVDFQVGDQIKFNAGDFGGLSQAITLTFGTDDILNSSQTPANLNNWDTSNVTDFEGTFTGNLSSFGTPANKVVVNLNNWNLSSAVSLKNFGGGEFNTTSIFYSGSNFAPKAVSAVDSPTGVAYTAWDTSNITDFTNIKYLGDNIPGVLKYWRFNTSSTVNFLRFLNGRDLSSFVSLADEPCKTQVIPSGDAGNPYGVDYTAWNMEKASNLSNFAYRTSTNTGISNFEILTPALSSWQISDSLTTFNNFAAKASGVSTFTPTVGSWDPSGITGTNIWNYTNNGDAWKFSTTTYDQLLDIASGWGQHASTVNTGVTLEMGDSQYTPGGNAEAGRTALINAGWIFNDNGAVVPPTVTVDFLVIAGGGGGGDDNGSGWAGGGGAGGYRNSYNNETSGGNSASETALSVPTSTNVTVTVGDGGANSAQGANSVFYTITSIGGGAGGEPVGSTGGTGGSGGGAGTNGTGVPSRGLATANQGFDGSGNDGSWSGGGGGAGQAGGVNPPAGQGVLVIKGGDGLSSTITGTSVTRAGGGGGAQSGFAGAGGAGGGGTGGTPPTAGAVNTGSAGGGRRTGGIGGAGGSGIVILRYPSSNTITVGAGLTASTSTIGGDKVTIFTAGTGSISIA